MVKYLIIQYQESLNNLQSIAAIHCPETKMIFRNSTTVAAGNEKKRMTIGKSMKKGETMAAFQDLGFKDKVQWAQYQTFLTKYLAYTSDIMEVILALASLKCFP